MRNHRLRTWNNYEGRSFNCVTNDPPYRVAVMSMWKLQWFHGRVGRGGGGVRIFYNRMILRSNPFSLSKVIESSSWFSHIHSKVKVHYYEKSRPATGLRGLCLIHGNAPAHECVLVQDFLKEEKVVQLSHLPYSPDLSHCDFFLFPFLKKTLSCRRYESRSALGSAIYQCLQCIPKKTYFYSLHLQNGFRDLKSVFPSRENTSKGWSERNVTGINNAPCRTQRQH